MAKQVQLYDQMTKAAILTMEIPQSWESWSNVNWSMQDGASVSYEIKIWNPQGQEQFWLKPSRTFNEMSTPFFGTMSNSVPMMPPLQFFSSFILPDYQRQFPGLKILSSEDVQMSAQEQQQFNQKTAMLRQVNPYCECLNQTANVIAEYNLNGQIVNELLAITADGMVSANPFAGRMGSWSTYMATYRNAKRPKPEMVKEFNALAGTIRRNQEWEKVTGDFISQSQKSRDDFIRRSQESQSRHNSEMARMQQETFDYINNSRRQTFENQQRSSERTSHMWSETLRGVRTVYDPYYNRQVEINDKFNHTWMNNYGQIIQTDSHLYNPNSDSSLSGNWNEV